MSFLLSRLPNITSNKYLLTNKLIDNNKVLILHKQIKNNKNKPNNKT